MSFQVVSHLDLYSEAVSLQSKLFEEGGIQLVQCLHPVEHMLAVMCPLGAHILIQ